VSDSPLSPSCRQPSNRWRCWSRTRSTWAASWLNQPIAPPSLRKRSSSCHGNWRMPSRPGRRCMRNMLHPGTAALCFLSLSCSFPSYALIYTCLLSFKCSSRKGVHTFLWDCQEVWVCYPWSIFLHKDTVKCPCSFLTEFSGPRRVDVDLELHVEL